jgi:hypothetical protein
MLRLVLLLLVVAGVAGFFTRPQEPALREAADAVLSDPQDLGQVIEGGMATLAGNRDFTDYYVATRYVVTVDNEPVVTCYGAFTQVQCSRASDQAAAT